MKSLVTALSLAATLTLSASMVKAQTAASEQESAKAFKILLSNAHVGATDQFDPATQTRVSSLLVNMLSVSTPTVESAVTSRQVCYVESAKVLACSLLISDRRVEVSDGIELESKISIQYKVDLKSQKLVGKPEFYVGG